MDNAAPLQNMQQTTPQNTQVINQQQDVVQNATLVSQQNVAAQPASQPKAVIDQQLPQVPISGPSKEGSPIVSQPINQESNPVQLSEQEPVLSPEVKEAGVENVVQTDEVQVSSELKEAGVEPTKTAVPHPTSPSGAVSLSMTEEEAAGNIKTNSPDSSIRWLSTEIRKHYKRIKGLFVKENA